MELMTHNFSNINFTQMVTQKYNGKTLLTHLCLGNKPNNHIFELENVARILLNHCTIEDIITNIKIFLIEQTSKHTYKVYFKDEAQLNTIIKKLHIDYTNAVMLYKNNGDDKKVMPVIRKIDTFRCFIKEKIKQMNTTINLATYNRNNIKESKYKFYSYIKDDLAAEKK